MPCKLTTAQLFKRAVLATFTGPVTTGIGADSNYGFVVGPRVPLNMYQVVLWASLVDIQNAANQCPALYVIMNGDPQPSPSNAHYIQYPIFLSFFSGLTNTTNVGNGGPIDPAHSYRVDDMITNDYNSQSGTSGNFEQSLLRGRKPLILMEQQYLLGTTFINATTSGAAIGSQLILKYLFAQLDQTQDIEWI